MFVKFSQFYTVNSIITQHICIMSIYSLKNLARNEQIAASFVLFVLIESVEHHHCICPLTALFTSRFVVCWGVLITLIGDGNINVVTYLLLLARREQQTLVSF